jgi:anthraniloyl-CoA monooxygenase
MSQKDGIAFCERLFARYLDGERLMSNASHLRGSAIWIRFPRIVCDRWVHWMPVADRRDPGRERRDAGGAIDGVVAHPSGRSVPVVLMGDAAHTAHFSVGSGTKLALEDAIALARVLKGKADLASALETYEAERKIEVLKIQNAARNSTEWFENVERYSAMEAEQFTYSLLTRSQRISHENLRLRDRGYVERIESWIAAESGMRAEPRPPMFTQFKIRGLTLPNRIVMSPMAMYSCVDGTPDEFYLVHLGSRAHGGAGLVFTEMTCVTPRGRISPGCAGMYRREHMRAWKRIVDYVHAKTTSKIGMQLGHSGPKGSTRRLWEGADLPLPSGNWPLLAASPIAYGPENQRPKAMTREDMDAVKAAFVRAARWANEAGFDWLELHCAHGYLLSSFLCPLTNRRDDVYGGSLENRCRYPLEVFGAIRDAWPADKPMSVRISAHDWAEGGNTPDDAVEIARLFQAAGCDLMDVSSGQTTREAKPIYGRMYQTPFADRIRQETGIATIAVGAIFEPDHVNSIIAAGRADLCALARPHLADPYWTLHAAAQLRWRDAAWPEQYWSGRDQWVRNLERAALPQEVPDANG